MFPYSSVISAFSCSIFFEIIILIIVNDKIILSRRKTQLNTLANPSCVLLFVIFRLSLTQFPLFLFTGFSNKLSFYSVFALRSLSFCCGSFSIMSECWSEIPDNRPTFQWISTAIRRLQNDEKVWQNLVIYSDLCINSFLYSFVYVYDTQMTLNVSITRNQRSFSVLESYITFVIMSSLWSSPH